MYNSRFNVPPYNRWNHFSNPHSNFASFLQQQQAGLVNSLDRLPIHTAAAEAAANAAASAAAAASVAASARA